MIVARARVCVCAYSCTHLIGPHISDVTSLGAHAQDTLHYKIRSWKFACLMLLCNSFLYFFSSACVFFLSLALWLKQALLIRFEFSQSTESDVKPFRRCGGVQRIYMKKQTIEFSELVFHNNRIFRLFSIGNDEIYISEQQQPNINRTINT